MVESLPLCLARKMVNPGGQMLVIKHQEDEVENRTLEQNECKAF